MKTSFRMRNGSKISIKLMCRDDLSAKSAPADLTYILGPSPRYWWCGFVSLRAKLSKWSAQARNALTRLQPAAPADGSSNSHPSAGLSGAMRPRQSVATAQRLTTRCVRSVVQTDLECQRKTSEWRSGTQASEAQPALRVVRRGA